MVFLFLYLFNIIKKIWIVILSLFGGYFFTRFGCALSLIVTSVVALITYVISYLGVAVVKSIILIYVS